MKIKTGFITNSSSTSFIIMTKDSFLKDDFLNLIGVKKESDFYDMITELYEEIKYNMDDIEKFFQESYWRSKYKTLDDFIISEFSISVYNRYKKSIAEGQKIYIGTLSSDLGGLMTYFCCEYIELENEKIYFNYINSYW